MKNTQKPISIIGKLQIEVLTKTFLKQVQGETLYGRKHKTVWDNFIGEEQWSHIKQIYYVYAQIIK